MPIHGLLSQSDRSMTFYDNISPSASSRQESRLKADSPASQSSHKNSEREKPKEPIQGQGESKEKNRAGCSLVRMSPKSDNMGRMHTTKGEHDRSGRGTKEVFSHLDDGNSLERRLKNQTGIFLINLNSWPSRLPIWMNFL